MSRRLKYYYMYIENYLQLAELRGKKQENLSSIIQGACTKPFSTDTRHLYIYERLLWASAIDT